MVDRWDRPLAKTPFAAFVKEGTRGRRMALVTKLHLDGDPSMEAFTLHGSFTKHATEFDGVSVFEAETYDIASAFLTSNRGSYEVHLPAPYDP